MISRGEQAMNHALLLLFCLIALTPIVGVFLLALRPEGSVGSALDLSGGFHFENFARAWEGGRFDQSMRSSLIVVFAVVPIATVLSILAGYAFGTMHFVGDRALFFLMLFGLMVPLESTIAPLYYILRGFGLTNTYWALILPQAAGLLAFGTFWMRAYFLSSSRTIVEAARLDGASTWQTLWRVLVPMARPAILTMVVLQFMWTWNDFMLALVMVSSDAVRTAPLSLTFFVGRYSADFTAIAAGSIIVALPVVIAYLFLQRHFIRGIVSGALRE
jgi:raffinose/stachyose/melibiose transport system permease protein